MTHTTATPYKPIATWLLTCCALLFILIVVGGVTRLTRSGLSIVEWQPIVGAIPPLNTEQWENLLAKYRQTPEYQQVNFGMSLAEFKKIFWWEYAHRLLGRLLGLVYLLPFLYFLIRKKIDPPLIIKLIGIFTLGGLQAALGWYMVKSGLVDDPRVSQYRLTVHLGLAFIIYAAMFSLALNVLSLPKTTSISRLRKFSFFLTAMIFLMVLSGGLVAGIRAGYAYNTFPLMNGHWIPPEILLLDPWYLNFFNNMATVQFNHRLLAWLMIILIPLFWWRAQRQTLHPSARLACHLLLLALLLQIALGISTLLLHVPVTLGAAHQAGAAILFTVALWVNHQLGQVASR